MKKYTDLINRQVKINRKKTFLASSGIMIGIILLTLVLVFSNYSRILKIQASKINSGQWEASYNLTDNYNQKYEQLKNNTLVENVGIVASQTYDNQVIDKSKVNIKFSKLDNVAINNIFKLGLETFGAYKDFPTNSNEVILDNKVKNLGITVGQSIKIGEKEYKVKGFFDDNKTSGTGNIIALTKFDGVDSNFSVKAYTDIIGDSSNIMKNIETVTSTLGYKKSDDSQSINQYEINDENLKTEYGIQQGNESITSTGFEDIIVAVVATIISLIINYGLISFTLADKVKQFGVLRCIGATPKQIRTIVYKEVGIISLFSIVPGIVLGYLGVKGITVFMSVKFGLQNYGVKLGVYPVILLVILFLSVFSILLAALRPAFRAGSISPIEGIRSGRKTNLNIKKRNSKFVRKLFGIEGEVAYKNILAKPSTFWTSIILLSLSFIVFIVFTTYISITIHSKKDELNIRKQVEVEVYNNFNIPNHEGEFTNEQLELMKKETGIKLYNQSVKDKEKIMAFLNTKVDADIATSLKIPRAVALFINTDAKLNPDIINKDDSASTRRVDVGQGKSEVLTFGDIVVYNDAAFNMIKNKINGKNISIDEFNDNGVILVNAQKNSSNEEGLDERGKEIPAFTSPIVDSKMQLTFADYENNELVATDIKNPEEVLKLKGRKKPIDVKVIGTMPAKYTINDRSSGSGIGIIISESFFKKHFSEILGNYENGTSVVQNFLFDFKSNEDLQNNLVGVQEYFELNHNSSFVNKFEEVNSLKNTLAMIVFGSYGVLAIICAVLLVSIIISKNLSVSVRKKEFGTLLAIGMSKKALKKSIILESILQFLVVIIISVPVSLIGNFIVIKYLKATEIAGTSVGDVTLILITIFVTFIVVMLTSLVPLKKFKKLDMVEMMREEE